MKPDEVQHLAALARIRITEDETKRYATEMNDILEYVSAVQSIAGSFEPGTLNTPHYNVFRADEATNQPGEHTQAILDAMPDTDGRYMKVKRILNQDS